MRKIVRCYECDSEYIIEYEQGMLSEDPKYCICCSDPDIEIELITDDE